MATKHWQVITDLTVEGRVASISGTYTRSILKDAQAGGMEHVHVAAEFGSSSESHDLSVIEREDDLANLADQEKLHILARVRVPRLLTKAGFWPPTIEEAKRAEALIKKGEAVMFDSLGISSLGDAWRFKSE